MPRSKKSIWDSFTAIHVDGVKRAKCKACAGDVVKNPARMEKHLAKCQPVVINVDEQTASSSVQGPPAKVLKQSTLQVLSTSAVKQHEIDLSVTRYFIATNTPFNAASNRHLKSLVQKLRPGTTIPERRKISGELLDEVYDQEKQKVKQQVQKAHVTLAIDGWSALANDPVLGISFFKSGVCYLVNTINTSGANMNLMRREIRQDLDGVIHTYGCHAHIANLLSKDILNQRDIKPLLSKVMAVLKFLRNSHACSAELKEKKINRPPADRKIEPNLQMLLITTAGPLNPFSGTWKKFP